jgi:hypothetical protein
MTCPPNLAASTPLFPYCTKSCWVAYLHRPDDGSSTHFWNVGLHRDHSALYPRRLSFIFRENMFGLGTVGSFGQQRKCARFTRITWYLQDVIMEGSGLYPQLQSGANSFELFEGKSRYLEDREGSRRVHKNMLWWEVYWVDSGLCPMLCVGIGSIEPPVSTTTELVGISNWNI